MKLPLVLRSTYEAVCRDRDSKDASIVRMIKKSDFRSRTVCPMYDVGTFSWALACMRAGLKVRVPEWSPSSFLVVEKIDGREILLVKSAEGGQPRVGEYTVIREVLFYNKWDLIDDYEEVPAENIE